MVPIVCRCFNPGLFLHVESTAAWREEYSTEFDQFLLDGRYGIVGQLYRCDYVDTNTAGPCVLRETRWSNFSTIPRGAVNLGGRTSLYARFTYQGPAKRQKTGRNLPTQTHVYHDGVIPDVFWILYWL